MNDIDKWLDYCRGADYETGDFYTLLMEANSDDVSKILAPLDNSVELEKRLSRVMHLQKNGDRNKARLQGIIAEDIKLKKAVLDDIGDEEDLLKTISSAENNYCFVQADEFLKLQDEEESWVNAELLSLVGQEFIYAVPKPNKRISSALKEAIYGITSNYNLVWYVLGPLTSHTFSDFDQYILLWEVGVDYLVSEKGVFVLRD